MYVSILDHVIEGWFLVYIYLDLYAFASNISKENQVKVQVLHSFETCARADVTAK